MCSSGNGASATSVWGQQQRTRVQPTEITAYDSCATGNCMALCSKHCTWRPLSPPWCSDKMDKTLEGLRGVAVMEDIIVHGRDTGGHDDGFWSLWSNFMNYVGHMINKDDVWWWCAENDCCICRCKQQRNRRRLVASPWRDLETSATLFQSDAETRYARIEKERVGMWEVWEWHIQIDHRSQTSHSTEELRRPRRCADSLQESSHAVDEIQPGDWVWTMEDPVHGGCPFQEPTERHDAQQRQSLRFWVLRCSWNEQHASVQGGWPDSHIVNTHPSVREKPLMRNELSMHDGLITRGSRMVIPMVMDENMCFFFFFVQKRRESGKEKSKATTTTKSLGILFTSNALFGKVTIVLDKIRRFRDCL